MSPVTSPRPRLLTRIGPGALALVALAFIAFALPPYLSLDPARSRIPPPAGVPAYYPLLVVHVVFASIAMVTACVQLSPWVRQMRPAWHRLSGRLYIFGGVLPAGLAGLVIGVLTPFGPIIRASNVLLAVLWLTCTLVGFRMARGGRYADHRRWMTRSITLTLSIITNRIWAVVFTLSLGPQLHTTFGGNEMLMVHAIAGLSGWLGWVLPLLAVEWWVIERARGFQRPTSNSPTPNAQPQFGSWKLGVGS
jgi:uncharacterized membrane protein